MSLREIVDNDLRSEEITDINSNLFYMQKDEDVECNCYMEWNFIDKSRSEYSADTNMCDEAIIQVDIYANILGLEDYYKLEEAIQNVLDSIDYYTYDNDIELYEKDTKLYHRGFRYLVKKIK